MSREHAYAYEAGYRDGSIHYELEHCPACKNVADLQEALADNAKLRELLRGWQVYAIDNTFGDIYKSEDVVDSNVVTFCDKHGYRLYTSMEVYGLLHDPNANERILTHDELPETIPCSEVFADIDV